MLNTSTWNTIGGDLRAVVTWIIDYLRKRLKRLDRDMTAFGYVGLSLYAIWSLWLLLFVIHAAEAKGDGLGFLVVGIILSLLHRPLGWLMFNIGRAFHIRHQIRSEAGQQGTQALYLGLGLVSIGIGCIYLVRSII
jgi:hypothetical protein